MKTLLSLLLFYLANVFPPNALHAADAPVSHRLLITDYGGNRVCILSAKGEIEWEYPASTPQDCWMLANGNVLFSQITGAVEVTRDKKVVWMLDDWNTFGNDLCTGWCLDLPEGTIR